MPHNRVNAEANLDNAENVEQIRDIIFGTQIKEFETQLKQVNLRLKVLFWEL
jgi:hypothetical protein